MATKFVTFTDSHDKKPILVNPDHVRTASETCDNKVTLVMDQWEGGGHTQDVEGDLKSVWTELTK